MLLSTNMLEFEPLGDDSWRLCDRDAEEHDPRSLVAYVERVGDRYDVVWLQCPPDRTTFDTLDAVREYARTQLEQAAAVA